MIKIADTEPLLIHVKKIRYQVFVLEQGVGAEDEFDQYETQCRHFLAFETDQDLAVGTARWRQTVNGIKLERFAVLHEYRNQGIGKNLLDALDSDIAKQIESPTLLYLHAQLPAVNFYQKVGFSKTGEIFDECEISHIRMEKLLQPK